MRIAVLGDFHLHPKHYDLTMMAMQDLAECHPDLVVPLGDFGSKGAIGGIEGLHESKPFLDAIGAPVRPILGNHDLQRESGEGTQVKGVMERELNKLFHLSASYGTLEYEDFRLFFASTEPQSADSCYNIQECFTTDEQFESLVFKLNERRGIPVIFFTHAPPIGCGLRTVPRVHVRSTNAYLDQNHNPYRWRQLYREYPEIIGWFSAHYHLGHSHIDSHCERWGTHFFHTGVHSTFTRDGQRHSRIIDISVHGFHVQTLDHQSRSVTNVGEFRYSSPISTLVHRADFAQKQVEPDMHGLKRRHVISVGEAPTLADQLVPIGKMRFISSTEDGYSWEVDLEAEAVMGTLHIGPPLRSLCASSGFVWFTWDHFIGRTELHDPWRFVRVSTGPWPKEVFPLDGEAACLTSSSRGGIWFSVHHSVYRMGLDGEYSLIFTLQHKAKKIQESDAGLWILDVEGNLSLYGNTITGEMKLKASNIAAFDTLDDQSVMVRMDESLMLIWTHGEIAARSLSLKKQVASLSEMHTLQTICLGDGKVLLNLNGTVYLWVVEEDDLLPVSDENGKASSISRVYPTEERLSNGFVVSRDSNNAFEKSRLELWDI